MQFFVSPRWKKITERMLLTKLEAAKMANVIEEKL